MTQDDFSRAEQGNTWTEIQNALLSTVDDSTFLDTDDHHTYVRGALAMLVQLNVRQAEAAERTAVAAERQAAALERIARFGGGQ
ncbi:hypothetical protein [Corynebacterium glyciniphilum]|uniref:hypothetical protein n=1 Tax=Corynebacterium glyciniphilum TaxID=1404244 RepID=UPI003FD1941A